MKGEEFLNKMELIDPEFIEKAEEKPKKHRTLKWVSAIAACICIIIAIPILNSEPHEIPQHETEDPGEMAPNIKDSDGRRFFISPHIVVFDKLPEGFEYSGTADISGFENVPYYTNPEVPEWIYVYHEVNTNGKIDSSGTLIPAEPHNAYVRYVDERIRGAHLIFLDGEYYISMWSAKPYGDYPDVTSEYYDRIENTCGIRISGDVPEGFSYFGTTVFSGYDTVPKENFHCNYGTFDVYTNPAVPEVILVSAQWHTAESDKNGTVNKGFDVYIRYDCPFA